MGCLYNDATKELSLEEEELVAQYVPKVPSYFQKCIFCGEDEQLAKRTVRNAARKKLELVCMVTGLTTVLLQVPCCHDCHPLQS